MDWTKLIEDLAASGMSQKEIGDSVGKSQAWVSSVARAEFADVPWAVGQALIALHKKACSNKRKAA